MKTMFGGVQDVNVSAVDLNPMKYYSLIELVKSIDEAKVASMSKFSTDLEASIMVLDAATRELAETNDDMKREMRRSSRRLNDLDKMDDPGLDEFRDRFKNVIAGTNFISLVYDTVYTLRSGYNRLHAIANGLKRCAGSHLILSKEKFDADALGNPERLQHMMLEYQLNQGTLQRIIGALSAIDGVERLAGECADRIVGNMENYYRTLNNRHGVDGIEIHEDPITTDLAITVFDNVDAHGEIEDGLDPKELSAYSINKAKIVTEAVKGGVVGQFIRDHDAFVKFIDDQVRGMHTVAMSLKESFRDELELLWGIIERPLWSRLEQTYNFNSQLSGILRTIKDLDPQSVRYRDKNVLLSSDERFNLRFRNETLGTVARMLKNSYDSPKDIVEYILGRKKELHDYFQGENSFYVCKIGAGNAFTGKAPGALEVIPGTKPVSHLEEVLGSGFDEIREFFSQTDAQEKWHDLFLATSPSKKVDKNNVLLIGPQGCGKTEVFRAVGADKDSLSIACQGSDFNTCWKGEAEKNPKRLFEAAVRLQKESKKHVHILLDEIDDVLNTDRDIGGFNLTTEFQILMDGVVSYPRISIWGATNNPRRIPMPMIRRFSKVLIVGELDQNDRAQLLRRFCSFMPIEEGIDMPKWLDWAKSLEGATGDVVRKVADEVWRLRMSKFVRDRPQQAEQLIKWLNDEVKFDIKDFSSKKRKSFLGKLREHVVLSKKDIDRAVELALDNRAIHEQVETAKLTYANARQFMTNLQDSRA